MNKEILPGLEMKFQPADLRDADMMGYIYYHSWMSTVRDLLSAQYLEPYTPESLASAMFRLIGTTFADYFLIDIGGEPSAMATVDCSGESPVAEINHLFLLPEYIGKGYGTRVLCFLLKHAAGRGKKQAALWVNTANERAVRFYESHGFVPAGEERTLYMGVEMIERRYICTIEEENA